MKLPSKRRRALERRHRILPCSGLYQHVGGSLSSCPLRPICYQHILAIGTGMDRISPDRRSRNMALIPSSDTRPELRVRRLLHSAGYRFRLHRRDLPGKPDIVLPRHRTVILVHGCYWHRHLGCRLTTSPKTNTEFWQRKFARNVERDRENEEALINLGWHVVTIWECETRNPEFLGRIIDGLATDRTKA